KDIMHQSQWQDADAMVLDAGVSSPQFDQAERGFSFHQDGPLDMRMDPSQSLKASDILNEWSEEAIADVFKQYGQERHYKRLTRAIVHDRTEKPFESTLQLEGLIFRVIGKYYRNQKIHPATRAFQALRICVNDELASLGEFLEDAVQCLKQGGRIAVISFHSLEDRLVKHTFKKYAMHAQQSFGGRGAPCLKILTKKPVSPSLKEIGENPRSRSGKLRAVERIL
ncbi:MAG: 16S rRNA (cytosine(1402)-N(4))-methyltransferase RsmH, partial [Chlamydiota bacterium]|nr:16S rRNA (cytosine(1402)-N(4))-methyltransferase RsmH [Chlamydiota bacterium]